MAKIIKLIVITALICVLLFGVVATIIAIKNNQKTSLIGLNGDVGTIVLLCFATCFMVSVFRNVWKNKI